MRYLTLVLASAGLLALAAGNTARSEEKADTDTKEFFNGKDLDGWEGLTEYWSVKDGAIVGDTHRRRQVQHLPVQQEEVQGLRAELQGPAQGRRRATAACRSAARSSTRSNLAVKGPQCDIGEDYWGSLYGEHFGGMMKQAAEGRRQEGAQEGRLQRLLHQGASASTSPSSSTARPRWMTTSPSMPDEGIIAWQLHAGKAMEVMFKDIEFKDLSKK